MATTKRLKYLRDKKHSIVCKIYQFEKQLDDLNLQKETVNSSILEELWVVYPIGTTVIYDCDSTHKDRGVVYSIIDCETLQVLDERGCLMFVELGDVKRIVKRVKV